MRTKLLTMMTAVGLALAAPAFTQSDAVSATGTIKKVDQAKRTVNLSHAPIPAVNWPAMTMDFAVAPEVDLSALKPGQQVEFKMKGSGMAYTITEMKPKRAR